ncbi:hypothetical protein VPH35_116703 [Triticum aestivum]
MLPLKKKKRKKKHAIWWSASASARWIRGSRDGSDARLVGCAARDLLPLSFDHFLSVSSAPSFPRSGASFPLSLPKRNNFLDPLFRRRATTAATSWRRDEAAHAGASLPLPSPSNLAPPPAARRLPLRPSAFSSVDLGWSILPVGAWLDRPTSQLRRQPALLRLFRHPARLPPTGSPASRATYYLHNNKNVP